MLLLAHVPPVGDGVSVVVIPTHTDDAPLSVVVFTVTTADAGVPQPVEYCIVAVPPGANPVTSPFVSTVATPVLLLLQVSPVVASVNAVVASGHIPDVPPDIAAGIGVTNTSADWLQPETV